jgi:hypothetical protein
LVPNGCPSIAGKTQFNFVILPTDSWASATDAAYGSVSIATSGANWTLASYQLQTLAGTPAPGNGTALPAGTCAPNAAGTAVYLPSNPLSISLSLPLPQTIAVGPSGFYIADQGLADGNTIGNPGEFGVIQPSSALLPSDILSANYLGFIFEPGVNNPYATLNNPTPESQMASFGPTVPAGQLLGGGFPNDDPTQPVIANLSIDLGAQSTTANGVFPDALVTNANSTSVCPDGITTPCPYSAVAVVGNAEGKFSIFIIGEDGDNFLPFGIYLFQQ